jgi:serine/threonine-protein kinase
MTVCGWTIERPLRPGPVCASWLGLRGAERAVVRVLSDAFVADDRARAQWLRASWAANRFHHARVVKVLEQGVDERGVPVLVRGWARGETLEETVLRGVLAPMPALRLIEQLLDAIEMAHAHGIVHGAISPSNVVVTAHGSVRLMDFAAMPELLELGPGERDALAEARVGSFTAPERRTPHPVAPSEQADIWGIGACLYCAMVGKPPGADPGLELTARAHTAESLSDDVAALVSVSLGRDPLERYESAYAMLGDVRRLLSGRKPNLREAVAAVPSQGLAQGAALPPPSSGTLEVHPTAPPPRRSSERWGNVLLVIAIAVLVGLATFVMMRERLAEAPPTPATAPTR